MRYIYMMAIRFFGTLILLFTLTFANAQENPSLAHRMQLRFSGNVPHPVSNKAFRRSFTGIYDLNLSYRIRIFSGFSAGLAYKHVIWKTPDNKIPGLNTYGQFNGGAISISYDHAFSETATGFVTINAGQARMHYYGLSMDSIPDNFQSNYVFNYGEFETGAYFYTEGNFAIGVQFGMVFTNYGFDPYKLALDEHKAYIASDLEGNVVQMNIGFSVVYSFLKKKGGG